MFTQTAWRVVVSGRGRIASAGALIASLLLPLVLSLPTNGCSAPPPPVAGPDPADPGARAPRVGYRPTIAPYSSQRPVEPAPWGEQNQRVVPQPNSDHEQHR